MQYLAGNCIAPDKHRRFCDIHGLIYSFGMQFFDMLAQERF